MNKISIRTNNVPRPIVGAWELSPEERKQFDYLDWDSIERGADSASFFRYRGELYDLSEFCRVIHPEAVRNHPTECAEPAFAGWDGYASDSFFSGMLVRYPRDERGNIDSETIVVGSYCS